MVEYVMVVGVFSVVQSIFGMGLLVFGTPMLLLLGANYGEILSILLPSSISLSCMQIWGERGGDGVGVTARQIAIPVPFIALGLAASLLGWIAVKLDLLVAAMLFLAALIRLSKPAQAIVYDWLRRRQVAYLAVMGLLHGLSNMGGSLLAIYATSMAADKGATRQIIARFYLVFGLTQLGVLLAVSPAALSPAKLALVPIAVLAHVFIGGRIYNSASNRGYQKALSFFIGMYGVSLLLKHAMLS